VWSTLNSIWLRFLRIWPVYSLVFLGYWKFYSYALDGPVSGIVANNDIESCNAQWPFMLTFLTNWTYGIWEKAYPYCMSWYWYIPNDFQYFSIAIFSLVLYARKPKIFFIVFGLMNACLMAVEGWVIWDLSFGPNLLDIAANVDYYKQYYLKFYTRSSPFFIGVIFGIWFAKYKRDVKGNITSKTRNFFELIKDSKWLSFILWASGLFLMLGITFSTYWSYDTPWPRAVNFLYNFLSRRLYVIGLFMFCFPLMQGNLYILGGWFGHDIFLPLAKLSFSVYIVHPLLVRYVIFNVRQPIFFNGYYINTLGVGLVVASYLVAILACTLFEMPFQNVRNIFKAKGKVGEGRAGAKGGAPQKGGVPSKGETQPKGESKGPDTKPPKMDAAIPKDSNIHYQKGTKAPLIEN